MEQEATYVGIDLAKSQVGVAIRLADVRWWVSHDNASTQDQAMQLKHPKGERCRFFC